MDGSCPELSEKVLFNFNFATPSVVENKSAEERPHLCEKQSRFTIHSQACAERRGVLKIDV